MPGAWEDAGESAGRQVSIFFDAPQRSSLPQLQSSPFLNLYRDTRFKMSDFLPLRRHNSVVVHPKLIGIQGLKLQFPRGSGEANAIPTR